MPVIIICTTATFRGTSMSQKEANLTSLGTWTWSRCSCCATRPGAGGCGGSWGDWDPQGHLGSAVRTEGACGLQPVLRTRTLSSHYPLTPGGPGLPALSPDLFAVAQRGPIPQVGPALQGGPVTAGVGGQQGQAPHRDPCAPSEAHCPRAPRGAVRMS